MAVCFEKDSVDYKCPLCSHSASTTIQGVLLHIRAFHANDPNFCVTCGLDGCATSSRSFSGFYSHIYQHHSDYISKRGRYVDCTTDVNSGSHSSTRVPAVILQENELDAPLTDHGMQCVYMCILVTRIPCTTLTSCFAEQACWSGFQSKWITCNTRSLWRNNWTIWQFGYWKSTRIILFEWVEFSGMYVGNAIEVCSYIACEHLVSMELRIYACINYMVYLLLCSNHKESLLAILCSFLVQIGV